MEQQDQGQAAPQEQAANEGQQQSERQAEKSFSQADVNKIMGDVRNDASGTILKSLGYEDLDSLKSDVGSLQQQREAAKSDLEKERESNSTLKTENDQLYARIAEREMHDSLRDGFIEAGANPGRVAALSRIANLDNLDIDDDGNVTGVEEEVKKAQEVAPEFFGNPTLRRAPDLTGGGGGGNNQPVSEESFNQRLRQKGLGGG